MPKVQDRFREHVSLLFVGRQQDQVNQALGHSCGHISQINGVASLQVLSDEFVDVAMQAIGHSNLQCELTYA